MFNYEIITGQTTEIDGCSEVPSIWKLGSAPELGTLTQQNAERRPGGPGERRQLVAVNSQGWGRYNQHRYDQLVEWVK